MDFDKRAEHTMKIWGVLMVGLVATMLFTSETLGFWSLGLAVLIVGAGITTTGFIWNWGEYAKGRPSSDLDMDVENAKRKRLSMALRDLSDSELTNLRGRLARGEIDDQQLERLLDEERGLDKLKR